LVGGVAGGLTNGAKSAIPSNSKDLGQAAGKLGGLFGGKKKPQ
jgi:hypothetical protein